LQFRAKVEDVEGGEDRDLEQRFRELEKELGAGQVADLAQNYEQGFKVVERVEKMRQQKKRK